MREIENGAGWAEEEERGKRERQDEDKVDGMLGMDDELRCEYAVFEGDNVFT